ncbi:MAG: hypothetical protein ACREGR_03890 [Minisyncoccia bacterium]
MDELPPELERRIAKLPKKDQEMIRGMHRRDIAADQERARVREEKAKKILG